MGGSADGRTTSAREVVTSQIARLARRFPQLHASRLPVKGLDERDDALARAIHLAVIRRWLTLSSIVETRLRRSWGELQPEVQAALLVGSAQLLLLDRLPDHAVINEAVEWTKRRAPRAAGLVNAILRRVAALRESILGGPADGSLTDRDLIPLHDGRSWRLREPVFAEEPLARLAEQTSHPEPLLRRWADRFGMDRTVYLALHDLVHPPTILAGLPGVSIFEGDREALTRLLAEHPQARVQDPGAAAAVDATAGLMPGLIVDFCAGLGTKTRQLASLHPRARVVATDVKADKLAALRQAFDGHPRVAVAAPDELLRLAGAADLVVADVPCSNTAVLARRVEARYRVDAASLGSLVNLQREILAEALRCVADAGCLLYSTCSLEPEENLGQVEWLTRWHPLEVRQTGSPQPRGLPGESPAGYTDGGFFALLRRRI